jgi:hypothetical protein
MVKKAQSGAAVKAKPAKKKTYPLLGIETPTPGSENGKRGLPLSKQIQDDIKSGKINKDGSWKGPLKMGGKMKKAEKGGSFDLNKDGKTTFKDVLIGRGVLPKTAKNGTAMKKQAATAIAMKKAGVKPKGMKSGGMMNKCKYGCK